MPMRFPIRYRPEPNAAPLGESVDLDPAQTALLVCDVWDAHWCRGASVRVADMAPALNATLRTAREAGILIIHAPSDTMDFYRDAPQRTAAEQSPPAESLERPTLWESRWTPLPEPPLPIDDSDGGCTEEPPCPQGKGPWSRQHAALEIFPEDIITDRGDEVFNVCRQRGIENLLICGVHTNMCVLRRSFGIRAMTRRKMNVLLMRDMTDTMYNPRCAPFVSHFRGTELVIAHIETFWCPTFTSAALVGGAPFRFREDS